MHRNFADGFLLEGSPRNAWIGVRRRRRAVRCVPDLVLKLPMKRSLIALASAAAVAATLLAPSWSSAAIQELGIVPASSTPTVTSTSPSCPGTPCLAVSRTTGYQAKVGSTRSPFVVPTDGRIVAWTITLGAPNAKQISFFNTNEGGAASAAIAVLAPGAKLNYTLVAQSPVVLLQPYFGGSVQFPLVTTLPVKKGDIVALTVPTWAPSLALGYNSDTSWRASRAKSQCTTTNSQTALQTLGSTVQFYCLYKTARLTYSATLVSNPVLVKSTTTSTTTTTTTTTTTSTKTTSTKTTSTRKTTSTATKAARATPLRQLVLTTTTSAGG